MNKAGLRSPTKRRISSNIFLLRIKTSGPQPKWLFNTHGLSKLKINKKVKSKTT